MKVNERIGRAVDMLMTYRQEKRMIVAALLGVSPKTLGRRLSGQLDWTAEEVSLLAEHFDVPVSAFYAGPDALLAGLRGKMSATLPGAFADLVAA